MSGRQTAWEARIKIRTADQAGEHLDELYTKETQFGPGSQVKVEPGTFGWRWMGVFLNMFRLVLLKWCTVHWDVWILNRCQCIDRCKHVKYGVYEGLYWVNYGHFLDHKQKEIGLIELDLKAI
ncbi:hypothetical protein L1987_76856 [Smallanthus sonchifolius]|uniref:Uncharacterized protein n=1 Tax=Smallanthus sonchifolius TaxID=185202 RepID=A0ACB8Z8T8_9ASTR|nr:hypothetical protein L1987_76856 [Smallanthus sonchifolius]